MWFKFHHSIKNHCEKYHQQQAKLCQRGRFNQNAFIFGTGTWVIETLMLSSRWKLITLLMVFTSKAVIHCVAHSKCEIMSMRQNVQEDIFKEVTYHNILNFGIGSLGYKMSNRSSNSFGEKECINVNWFQPFTQFISCARKENLHPKSRSLLRKSKTSSVRLWILFALITRICFERIRRFHQEEIFNGKNEMFLVGI